MVVASTLLLTAAAARADDPVTPATGTATAPATTFEFTVTERKPVTASSTLTVPAEDFALRPLESGGQMLEAVPGAMTAQHTGGGKAEQYFIRGFDADHGTDLAVYFDGVPINLRSHAHGQGFLDLHFVTKETIERLDAHKGPYFARYGDFATAAAIDYVPFDSLERSELKFEAGEWDTWRWVGVASPRFGAFGGDDPSASGLASFEAYHTDGPFRSDEDLWRFSGLARGRVELAPGLALSGHLLGYHADWNASGLIPERLVDAGELDRFGSLDSSEGGDSTRAQGKLQLDWAISERRHLMAQAYVAYYELDLFSNFTYELNDPARGDGIVQRDDRVYTGGRVEYAQAFQLGIPGLLRGGAEWRYDDAHVRLGTQTERDFTGPTSDDDVRELSLGPYLETELLLLPWVRFVGGVRFEHFRWDVHDRLPSDRDVDDDDSLWLPKANLVLAPFGPSGPFASEIGALRELELFGNFGMGFHSNDVRASSDDPEILARATGAEVGLRTRPFRGFEVALDAFWLELEDELVFVGDEGTTESGGQTRRWGVELVAHADLAEWLYLRGDVGYTSARTTDGNEPVPQAPRLIAKSAVGVRYAGFSAELSVRHLGDRYASEDSDDPRLTDYSVLDLGVRYRHERFEVGLAVENLTDTHWRSSEFFYESCAPSEVGVLAACPVAGGGEGVGDRHFTPGNDRNVRGWVSVRF
jgi:outer membrane receptor protein involved in Fe transport